MKTAPRRDPATERSPTDLPGWADLSPTLLMIARCMQHQPESRVGTDMQADTLGQGRAYEAPPIVTEPPQFPPDEPPAGGWYG